MDADAPFRAAVTGNPRVALRGQLLQGHGTFDGADYRDEFDQQPVTGHLDDPPATLAYERAGGGMLLAQGLRRASPVLPHQLAKARDIGGEDRGKAAGGSRG